MRDTQNTEARQLTVRTYEGVQWFKHEPEESGYAYSWVTPVRGTPLAIVRRRDDPQPISTHSCFLAVRRQRGHVHSWVHHDGWFTNGWTPFERKCIEAIDELMPIWTSSKAAKLRRLRYDTVSEVSIDVGVLNRLIVRNAEMFE